MKTKQKDQVEVEMATLTAAAVKKRGLRYAASATWTWWFNDILISFSFIYKDFKETQASLTPQPRFFYSSYSLTANLSP